MNNLRAIWHPDSLVLPESLSETDRERGRRLHYRFARFNGISIACLMDNMLILFAIRNHLTDPQVAVMASFIYLTMPFMIAGKRLAARIGIARTWALGWFCRYLSACLMIIAPFLHPVAPAGVVTALLMTGAFGFAFFRTIGVVAIKPLAGEITTASERGRFLSGNTMWINVSHLVTMLLIVLLLRFSDSLWAYQSILAIGCAAGFYTSTVIARIPESASARLSARRSLLETVATMWAHAQQRHLLFSWCAGFTAFTLVLPIMVIALKNGYGISDHAAFFFSSLFLPGAILIALLNGWIADRLGPRRLFQLYLGGLILVAAYWAAAPPFFSPLVVAATFLLAGGCKAGIHLSLSHYFLNAVDSSRRVGGSLIVQVFSGGFAGLAGAGLGGGLLKLLASMGMEGLAVYRAYFLVILPLLLAMTVGLRIRIRHPDRASPARCPSQAVTPASGPGR